MIDGCGLVVVAMTIRVFSFQWVWFHENPSIRQQLGTSATPSEGEGEEGRKVALYVHTASS